MFATSLLSSSSRKSANLGRFIYSIQCDKFHTVSLGRVNRWTPSAYEKFAGAQQSSTIEQSRTCSDSSSERLLQEDDELERKRDKSRLKPWIRRRYLGCVPSAPDEIIFDYQTTVKYRRRMYAKYGRESGVDPRIMWPSADQLDSDVRMQRELEPDLGDMLRDVALKKQEEAARLRERELKVDQQMSKLGGWMRELEIRKAKKIAEAEVVRSKKERLVDEVKEYFGYKLSPRDPKFQEVLEKKEKAERRAAKEARKSDKLSRDIARLTSMAQHQQHADTERQSREDAAGDASLASGDEKR